MSSGTLLILALIVAIVAYFVWRGGQRSGASGSTSAQASPVAAAGAPGPDGTADLIPENVTPERVRALAVGSFVKLDPEGPALPEELQITGKAVLQRATTDVDITTLSGRLEDWLAAYYATGQQDIFLQLQDKAARYTVLTELFVGGWGYYDTLNELAGDETNQLRDIAGAEAPSFDWKGERWRPRGTQTYKVQVQGESLIEDGTLLRVLAAGSEDGRRSFLFLDQWSGHNYVLTGKLAQLNEIISEIM